MKHTRSVAGIRRATFGARRSPRSWRSLSGRDREGTVEINDQGITYTAPHTKHGPQWLGIQHVGHALDRLDNRPHSLSWKWVDIQYFDRISRKEFVVLTYQDDGASSGATSSTASGSRKAN